MVESRRGLSPRKYLIRLRVSRPALPRGSVSSARRRGVKTGKSCMWIDAASWRTAEGIQNTRKCAARAGRVVCMYAAPTWSISLSVARAEHGVFDVDGLFPPARRPMLIAARELLCVHARDLIRLSRSDCGLGCDERRD